MTLCDLRLLSVFVHFLSLSVRQDISSGRLAQRRAVAIQTRLASDYGNGNGDQGNGNNGQSNGTGIPQANIAGATTIHGTVVSNDLTGMSITLDDGTALFVQLGNSRYSQSIGFAPQIGEGVTIYGFIGDQNLFSAIAVTLDTPDGRGQVYTFRSETGQPMWAVETARETAATTRSRKNQNRDAERASLF